jgi:Uma2 family endonuclease
MTAEDLESLYLPDKTTELVRGQLVVREPPSTHHGRVQAKLQYLVMVYVERTRAGVVFGQDTGFKIQSNPDTVRGPDLAFLAGERATRIPDRGFAALAPDLIAEVLSPGDRPGETLAKVAEFLEAGTRLVWVIDPDRRQAHVYRADGTVAIVAAGGSLDGEEILPGFRCPLSEVLT